MPKLLLVLCLLATFTLQAQKAVGLQQDYYHYAPGSSSFVPTIFYEAGRNNYLMARYNYEAVGTVALFWGKTWAHKTIVITPVAGVLAGSTTGLSASLQASWESNRFFASAEPQYCQFFSAEPDYTYNWLEAGANISDKVFAGLALQTTKEVRRKPWSHEPGFFAGISVGAIEVPLYVFRTKDAHLYMMLGLHWQWQRSSR